MLKRAAIATCILIFTGASIPASAQEEGPFANVVFLYCLVDAGESASTACGAESSTGELVAVEVGVPCTKAVASLLDGGFSFGPPLTVLSPGVFDTGDFETGFDFECLPSGNLPNHEFKDVKDFVHRWSTVAIPMIRFDDQLPPVEPTD
jgi:hypothetical protein